MSFGATETSTWRYRNFDATTLTSDTSVPSSNMSSLLSIASRIEAAVASYVLVQNGTDKAEWKRRFDIEKVSAGSSSPFSKPIQFRAI